MGICLAMQCWDPTISPAGSCVANVQQRAADGTTCANSSWCIMGQCVFNPIAPSAPREFRFISMISSCDIVKPFSKKLLPSMNQFPQNYNESISSTLQ